MKNNNGAITRKLTFRSFQSNKIRNIFVILAVMLTTILITAVFSIGISFMETSTLQQIRFIGTTADAHVNKLTVDQVEKLITLDYVKTVGEEFTVAEIKNSEDMSRKVSLSLHWFDKTQWEEFRLPTNSSFTGAYPEKYNEVMMPLWTLEQLGIENPKVGMEIPLEYYLENKDESTLTRETFILSGFYKDYMSARAGGFGYVAVSEDFAVKSGKTVEQDGSVSLQYKDQTKISEYNQRVIEDLSLTDYQEVRPWLHLSEGGSQNIAIAIFIAFIMLVGYLLIYNVLYISVSKDIRFYGLLKAIGTTPKQIKKIVTGQAVILSAIGILLGILVGALISLVLVPFVLNSTLLEISSSTSFNPLIFIGAAFFALVTTLISAVKPSLKASRISPIEAMRYTESTVKSKKANTTSGGKVYVMAWRNVFRDKKRAFVVLLSLFLGITVFMVTSSIVESYSFDNFIDAHNTDDFVLDNREVIWGATVNTEILDEDFISQVNNLQGVSNINIITMEKTVVKYNDNLSQHIDDFLSRYKYYNMTKESIIADFSGFIVGIDSSVVDTFNQNSENPIDRLAFEQGKYALIETDHPEHFEDISLLDVTTKFSGVNMRIPIGGFIPWNYQGLSGGGAPNIYVSKEALKKLSPYAPIGRVTFDVDDQYEAQAFEKMKTLIGDDPGIAFTSKIELKNSMSNEKMMLSVLGNGLSAILGLIGILNFINIMSTSIMARRHELAMLESIGMTKKQIAKMLNFEGLSYSIISTILVVVCGSAITYGAFTILKQMADFIVFSFPLTQLVIAIFMIFIVCIITPKVAYQSINRMSVVERLRESE